ncbi:methyltransferase domain-containing protein [Cohnella sp. CFH 77786]|uniref:class I SAM-dependent methyltransferase n=1 Tax=Cohnella sp. CFH 77786 TaxID=2662265 RepID=UPI001C60978E|nr:class I SAM-dependent methyltransferase [Cohnella sp. CFH 77786]MBW5448594.1 methyltransferase domain-containing protein [Cohnella sp. CFH 77786]
MDSKERFSSRVDAYVKYRPGYPKEAIDYLYETEGFRAGAEIADIGAGTGIFTKLLLERGSKVAAVEPNREMREAAAAELGNDPNFRALPGSAEATGLPGASVDFVVSAQAFHWFDRDAARTEFRRILKPGGKAALIWNSRLTSGSPFLEAYEQLLHRWSTDYASVNHKNVSEEILAAFFQEGTMRTARFRNRQKFDYDGLKGRLLSSSYAPETGHPNHEPMLRELRELFDRSESDGLVSFDYETEIYTGEV